MYWIDDIHKRVLFAHSDREHCVGVTMIHLKTGSRVKLDTFESRMFDEHELVVDWIDHRAIAIGMNTYGTVIFELDSPRNYYINDYDNFGPKGRLEAGVFQKRAKFGWKYVKTRVRDHVHGWLM
jgi:hypothetical protein